MSRLKVSVRLLVACQDLVAELKDMNDKQREAMTNRWTDNVENLRYYIDVENNFLFLSDDPFTIKFFLGFEHVTPIFTFYDEYEGDYFAALNLDSEKAVEIAALLGYEDSNNE